MAEKKAKPDDRTQRMSALVNTSKEVEESLENRSPQDSILEIIKTIDNANKIIKENEMEDDPIQEKVTALDDELFKNNLQLISKLMEKRLSLLLGPTADFGPEGLANAFSLNFPEASFLTGETSAAGKAKTNGSNRNAASSSKGGARGTGPSTSKGYKGTKSGKSGRDEKGPKGASRPTASSTAKSQASASAFASTSSFRVPIGGASSSGGTACATSSNCNMDPFKMCCKYHARFIDDYLGDESLCLYRDSIQKSIHDQFMALFDCYKIMPYYRLVIDPKNYKRSLEHAEIIESLIEDLFLVVYEAENTLPYVKPLSIQDFNLELRGPNEASKRAKETLTPKIFKEMIRFYKIRNSALKLNDYQYNTDDGDNDGTEGEANAAAAANEAPAANVASAANEATATTEAVAANAEAEAEAEASDSVLANGSVATNGNAEGNIDAVAIVEAESDDDVPGTSAQARARAGEARRYIGGRFRPKKRPLGIRRF